MGKNENESAEQPSDENTTSNEETIDKKNATEKNGEESSKPSNEPTTKVVKKTEESEDIKKHTDELRKVIKVGLIEENKKEKSQEPSEKKDEILKETDEDDSEPTTRESLEQRRAILQSIKDFDFQIKKNQEDIGGINQKIDSVIKDLDDLVSLYEIVSEQMNPFVGLSKVTKKRIDALENFTREIENLKGRMGDLESFAEKTGANIENFKLQRTELSNKDDKLKVETNGDNSSQDFSDEDLDKIIEGSLNTLSLEKEIDITIDEFIESILDENKK